MSLSDLFDEINAADFGGEVPRIPVEWHSRLRTAGGYCMFRRVKGAAPVLGRIRLNPHLLRDAPGVPADELAARLRRTLTHEMVHAWLARPGQPLRLARGHPPEFHAKMAEITGEDLNHRRHKYDTQHLRRWLVICPNAENPDHECDHQYGARTRRRRGARCRGCLSPIVYRPNPQYRVTLADVDTDRKKKV